MPSLGCRSPKMPGSSNSGMSRLILLRAFSPARPSRTRADEDRDRVKMFSPAVVIRPLARAELICAAILASALAMAVVWCFLLHVSLSATMLEYVFKFLPGLTDGGASATLDFDAF